MGINIELQSIRSFVLYQERLIDELKGMIREKDDEISRLKSELEEYKNE